jgi:tetratricopeptide (TPR) repeat protein
MGKGKSQSDYGIRVRRKKTIHATAAVLLIVMAAVLLTVVFLGWRNRLGNERRELLLLWDEGAYEEVFELSRVRLESKPLDYFLLTLHGFASYQLAVAQINNFDTLTYIDECIWSLRKALLDKEGAKDGRLHYVLGKAYYYKGSGYADLAVTYLEEALNQSYKARDIPEYLGLAYAAVQDYRSSVAAFTLALEPEEEGGEAREYPSDLLLLSIAKSYIALDEAESAKAYLIRCVETSRDVNTRVAARLLLGEILKKSGESEAAEAQYLSILAENGENAETHYQLGELYAAGGDLTKARAEWRSAVRIDPAHGPARTRLNM